MRAGNAELRRRRFGSWRCSGSVYGQQTSGILGNSERLILTDSLGQYLCRVEARRAPLEISELFNTASLRGLPEFHREGSNDNRTRACCVGPPRRQRRQDFKSR